MLVGLCLIVAGFVAKSFPQVLVGAGMWIVAALVGNEEKRTENVLTLLGCMTSFGLLLYNTTWFLYFLGAVFLIAFLYCLFKHTFLTIFSIWLGTKL